ncbi:ABC transporter ATP-binding protein [Leptolyngbya sp. AN02str]|uniref:ABC transporter ATP-binding protein n=1 Tax=Leptolyngbya sp. AN02str TaxID=3423363 RepID=UPI003D3202D6
MSSAKPRTRFWEVVSNTPRLLQLVWKGAPQWLVLSTVITLVLALIPVAQLYINKLIVDVVVSNLSAGQTVPDWQPLVVLVGSALVLALALTGFNQANNYVSQVLSDRFTLYANQVLLQQAINLDLAHYELPEFYDTLNRAQQSGSAYPVRVLGTLTSLTRQTVTFVGLLGLLLSFNPLIVLLLMFTALPALWVGIRFSGVRFRLMRRQTQSGRLAEYLQQVMTTQEFVKEVRLFNLGEHLLDQWHSIRTQFNQELAGMAAQQAWLRFAVGLFSTLGFYGAYGWVIVRTIQGAVTVGDLTMYTGAFQQSQGLIQGILFDIALIYEFNLFVSQYFEFLNLKPQVVNPPQPLTFPQPMRRGLELRNVSFSYPGATEPTLHHLNLKVQPGESIALVGTNGAGKTTLLKLLTRFYDVEFGEITVDGVPLYEFDLSDLRRNIGVVFQDFSRYNLSVQDNIGFGDLRQRGNLSRIQQAALDAGANPVIDALEHGYQTILGKTFSDSAELSGGQWQKIGLARAFMTPAQILILDEPTAALDAIAEFDLFQRFRQLTQGKMTFLVSHRFSTVRMADRIVVLEHGTIVEVGSHEQLMAEGGLYAKMFKLQASSYSDRTALNGEGSGYEGDRYSV